MATFGLHLSLRFIVRPSVQHDRKVNKRAYTQATILL